MINYEVTTLADTYDEIEDLVKNHYDEACFYEDMKVNPNLDIYRQLEENGYHFFMVARDEDYKIVGYIAYVITPLIQFGEELMADMELIYVLPEYRRKGLATSLIKIAEGILKEDRDVTVMSIKFKTSCMAEEFAVGLGYEPMEIMYSKRLGD